MSQSAFMALTAGPSSTCTWPMRVFSRTRDLDFTQCFEHAVLLPVPLLLTLMAASAQILSKRRRLRTPTDQNGLVWLQRGRASERVSSIKVVSQQGVFPSHDSCTNHESGLGIIEPDRPPRTHIAGLISCRLSPFTILRSALLPVLPGDFGIGLFDHTEPPHFATIFHSCSDLLAGLCPAERSPNPNHDRHR